MMKFEKGLWCVAVAASCLASTTLVHAYRYDGGPNFVRQSATRCRAETGALEDALTYAETTVTVNSGTSSRRLLCPLQRRSTSTYGTNHTTSNESKVHASSMFLRARDQHSTRTLSCYSFASAKGSGAVYFGATTYLCSTTFGCTSAPPASYTGSNIIRFSQPFSAQGVLSFNWGYACDVPGNSSLFFASATVSPN